MILVQANEITVKFQKYVALQAVSLTIERGKIITLIGPNGAGKSTLVKVVLSLITPQQGEVFRQKNLRVGYMPQKLNLDPMLPLTVERFLNLGQRQPKSQIKSLLQEVGASSVLKRPLQNVSGGELQRVLLARALLREPELLVLDEPVQGVDVIGQYELYELIAQLRHQRGCGILMVSHDLHLVMAATDEVVCLNQHICCAGHPALVSQHPAYLQLFGARAGRDLAIYSHHHHR
jgi:zinc transport system ATP-binding protein